MSKIVCVQSLSPHQAELIRQTAPDWDFVHGKEKELWLTHLKDAEIIVGWNSAVQEECLKPGSKLRWVQSWNAGVDNMPFEDFAQKDIIVTNASGVHAYPISETIIGMMLGWTRKIHLSIRNQTEYRKAGRNPWENDRYYRRWGHWRGNCPVGQSVRHERAGLQKIGEILSVCRPHV
ncbi:hypothetical protein [Paenibacillus sp. PvR098]|uniref:hypothetical protein n=1 Tax=unclassified Paenibacillus TaxID=185978 RepID=UPI001B65AEE0|nr:phosphoglycerate dehydrogenase-like enzyme [Paenibacillus sp. PvP091]MBP1169618.1 phosphoglycerate dehydrogenase-like enzyme [Paenibacillus sp. PvR098]MBP2440646.1 phosphoglycerate dehydrogenase-like enzyme [Paenibacillus sp. PvP052]